MYETYSFLLNGITNVENNILPFIKHDIWLNNILSNDIILRIILIYIYQNILN